MPGFDNWSYLPGTAQSGSNNGGTTGGGIPEPVFRDLLDARRSMYRRTPDAEYPDGYLGTIPSRNGDKILSVLQRRVNQRSYDRGVHKGERIDVSDYYWPVEINPGLGLALEARGEKFAPMMERTGAVNIPARPGGEARMRSEFSNPQSKFGERMADTPRGAQSIVQMMDPRRRDKLRSMTPEWR